MANRGVAEKMIRSSAVPLTALVVLSLMVGVGSRSDGATALDLSDRIEIDGFTGDFSSSEVVFEGDEESPNDSEWGPFNDVNQIRITWDKEFLYIGGEGFIGDAETQNNMLIWLDVDPDEGLESMTNINSWRRNFVFSNDFTPDLFIGTWDGNTRPRINQVLGPTSVQEFPPGEIASVATFDRTAAGRGLEVAIPWSIVFGGRSENVENTELNTTVWTVPAGMDTLRIAAAITAGPDGTGGPDSAPDNFGGHSTESSDQVTIDNYAWIALDGNMSSEYEDTVPGVVDFGLEPREFIGFKRQPPIRGITFKIKDLSFEQPIVSPEEGLPLVFDVQLDPPAPFDECFRTVSLTARIYDSLGNFVDEIYSEDERSVCESSSPTRDRWGGRNADGIFVPGGIYVLSVVSEPGLSRSTRAFAVVR